MNAWILKSNERIIAEQMSAIMGQQLQDLLNEERQEVDGNEQVDHQDGTAADEPTRIKDEEQMGDGNEDAACPSIATLNASEQDVVTFDDCKIQDTMVFDNVDKRVDEQDIRDSEKKGVLLAQQLARQREYEQYQRGMFVAPFVEARGKLKRNSEFQELISQPSPIHGVVRINIMHVQDGFDKVVRAFEQMRGEVAKSNKHTKKKTKH